jgi:beta-lactamase regulating signal transducer with metallopeptidase domain
MSLRFKRYVLTLFTLLTAATPIMIPFAVSAAPNCNSGIAQSVSTGASDAAGTGSNIDCSSTNVDTGSIGKLAHSVVNIFSIIVGAVAVLMVIYGGFRYITSGGESGRVGNAKNTLIYAVIGLLIVALAQLIVHFVLNQSNSITTGNYSS